MNNNNDDGNQDDKDFLLQLHMRAEQKAKEYAELLHERQRLEMRIERTKEYVEQLPPFALYSSACFAFRPYLEPLSIL